MCRQENKIFIKWYKNGYQVDGEDFCQKDDSPEHKEFYDSLAEGLLLSIGCYCRYVPHSLEKRVRKEGKVVVVNDCRTTEYHPPPPRFGYVSNRLDSST